VVAVIYEQNGTGRNFKFDFYSFLWH
jgi:hypothetical protein